MSLTKLYLNNWLQLLKKDRSHIMRKLDMGIRFYPAWRWSLVNGRTPLNDEIPWITFEARRFVESMLTPEAMVYEYGSGGSTLYYSRRVKRVISVEHDTCWFNRVKHALVDRGIKNCEYFLIPPEHAADSNPNPDDPTAYCSNSEHYRGYNFRRYASSIDLFPDLSFDFVAIDGRARPSCIYHARRKIKIGGYMMLDNSERTSYRCAKELLSGSEKRAFYGPGPYNTYFWETTVWKMT